MMLDAPHRAVLHLDRCTSADAPHGAPLETCTLPLSPVLEPPWLPFGNDTYAHPAYTIARHLGAMRTPQAGIQHLVWSGLEDPRTKEGVSAKLKEVAPGSLVPHFESKAAVTVRISMTADVLAEACSDGLSACCRPDFT